MIAEFTPPLTAFKEIIEYHEKKVNEGKASRIYNNTGEFSACNFNHAFETLFALNPYIYNKGYHISLNLPHNENLPESKFVDLAQDYLKGMEFGSNPYLLYKHTDKEHSHIHIIITNRDYDGTRWNDKFYKLRSQKLSRELEEKYDLKPTVYYKFNNENLNLLNERKYFFQKALQKALRSFSTKKDIESILSKDEIVYIYKNPLSNKDIENIIGVERYNKIGSFLEKNHLFKSLYKDTLLAKLDNIYAGSSSKGDFLKGVERGGLYVRHLSDKGKLYYVYGINDAAFYVKDKQLPMKYRYAELSRVFKGDSKYVLESEQKHIVYNRVMLSLKYSSTLDNFLNVLQKTGVSSKRVELDGKPEYIFKLKDFENPVDIRLSELSKKFNAHDIENKYLNYKDILSDTIIKRIELEEKRPEILEQVESSSMPVQKLDEEIHFPRKKKRGIGDRGRSR